MPLDDANIEYSKIEHDFGYDWVPDKAKDLIAELILLVTRDQLEELHGESDRSRRTTWFWVWLEKRPDFARAFYRASIGEGEKIWDLGQCEAVSVDGPGGGCGFVFFRRKLAGVSA